MLTGLKTALAYYTYARIVKNGDGNVTRYGFVQKENEYSSHIEFKEKVMAYDDAFSIADRYLKNVYDFCRIKRMIILFIVEMEKSGKQNCI